VADFSEETLLRSVSVVTLDDDAMDVPLVSLDDMRDADAAGGIKRSGNLQRFIK
jgi:hypothetical protein